MDKQTPSLASQNTVNSRPNVTQAEFELGATVAYGLHGKCTVASVETREIAGDRIRFYKLEIQRSNLSRSNRKDPAIWVPVKTAREKGLRPTITTANVHEVMSIIDNREYYFPVEGEWSELQPKIEALIRTEGAVGLAKACSYLFVLRKKMATIPTEATKMQENINKLLLRELSEATGENITILEDRISKLLRQKLRADH